MRAAGAFCVLLVACVARPDPRPLGRRVEDPDARSSALAATLAAVCPVRPADDIAAREACANALATLPVLAPVMREPFLWGTQNAEGDYRFVDTRVTRFNPLVWRKMYLSLEMFTGDYRVERAGERTVVRLGTIFRGRLDPGEYPYPFWHSRAKWDSYQFARELLLVFEGEVLVGALRSSAQDPSREATARSFDGNWDDRPEAVLFERLFSRTNPWVRSLDAAYREFEAESRPYQCASCHRPDNVAGQAQLEMLCYPNQALSSRHTIVRALEERRMPPPAAPGQPSGIADDDRRRHLLDLARRFETTAEAALAHEVRRPPER